MKKALITGVTGQDGSYLTELLLSKGYEVHGLKRRSATFNEEKLAGVKSEHFFLHEGDLTDTGVLFSLLKKIDPDEVYNLAAQSHVQTSWEIPEYTINTNGLGVLRLLEAIRILGLHQTKFYQASTSELFSGKPGAPIQTEDTLLQPQSPYALGKLVGLWAVRIYRQAYNIFACNGILFNHESERRGENFVTRKITLAATRIRLGLQDKLVLGNLSAQRDWGYAKDYVEAMWLMLQAKEPEDYIVATGKNHSVREFCEIAFKHLNIELAWEGEGVEEKGVDKKTGKVVVEVSPDFFRPQEVQCLLGSATKAKEKLNWQPKTSFEELVQLMVMADIELVKQEIKK